MTIKHKSVAEQLKEKGFKAPGIYRVVDGEVILGPHGCPEGEQGVSGLVGLVDGVMGQDHGCNSPGKDGAQVTDNA